MPKQSEVEFNEFVKRQGLRIWTLTNQQRRQHNHGSKSCNVQVPMLLGGTDSCHECETLFENILLELWQLTKRVGDPSAGSPTVGEFTLAA